MRKRKKTNNWIVFLILICLFGISVGYSALSSTLSMIAQVTITPPEIPNYSVKYAVQIYGINEDEDENGNPIGLSFGPALGGNYNNSYVTHEYEEITGNPGNYYVKIVTHLVASDNTETVNKENLKNSNGNDVIRTTEEKNKYDVNIHNMTWEQIANETDKTRFLDCMLCGDTKKVELTLNSTIGIENTSNQYGDGTGMFHETINPYYRCWNPSYESTEYPEANNSAATNGGDAGSNAKFGGGYSTSHIRATLIGVNSKTDVTYAGDVNLTTDNCLYSCIESDLKDVITAKKVKYATEENGEAIQNADISDKIWCLSRKELLHYGSDLEGIGTNGDAYSKFLHNESKYYLGAETNDSTIKRSCYKENGDGIFWWLRSSNMYTTFISDGSQGDGAWGANYSFDIVEGSLAFGFCLQGEYQVTFNANGGTGTMGNQTISNNVPTNLTENTFTKEGYAFSGWNTSADGNGTSYSDGEEVTNLGNIPLYAQWKKAYGLKYAVQLYGINEDVDSNDNPIGLTFGPATGTDYNNSYVTHEYEEITGNPGNYYVKIVTHTVAANNSETTTKEYLQNSSGNNVVRTLAEKNKYDINMHNMTWAQIAAVSDKTNFLDCMLCGDTKSVELALNSTIANTTIFSDYGDGTRINQYGDGAGVLDFSLNSYYKSWNPSYNNSDPTANNSAVGTGVILDSDELEFGSNARDDGGYSSSHIRTTLIGENSKTNIGYAGDVNLSESNSLYSCLPSSLKNVIKAKKVRYVTGPYADEYSLNDDITDKIWLISERELYGSGQYTGGTVEGLGNDGHGYNKFGNSDSKYYISSYNSLSAPSRVCYDEFGSLDFWATRSPCLDYSFGISYVGGDGASNGSFTNQYGIGVGFGFCID